MSEELAQEGFSLSPNTIDRLLREELGLGDEEVVVCGIALGYADTDAIENQLRSERADVDTWCQFID